MKKFIPLFTVIFLFTTYTSIYSQNLCNTDVSVCTAGVAGPFNFERGVAGSSGAGYDFAVPVTTFPPPFPFFPPTVCEVGLVTTLGQNFGFILLNITTGGPLNLLVNGNNTTGFIDVIVYRIPAGQDPCVAVMNSSNEIACNYASNPGGCMQFGNSFPCTSSVPAPNVNAGDQLMIIVHDYNNAHSTFSLQLGPGAQSGPLNATITQPADMQVTDPPQIITAANGGGEWSASCGACINPSTGAFDAAVAGEGVHEIYYTIGTPPCDGYDTTSIVVGVPCLLDFNMSSVATSCIGESDGEAFLVITNGVPPYSFQWNAPLTSTDSVVTGLAAGTYSVTVTDDSLCVVTKSITVADPAPFNVILGTDSTQCFGESNGQAFVASVLGGTAPYSYLWNDASNQTDSLATGLNSGVYSVTITDVNLCETIHSVEIFERPLLQVSASVIDPDCAGVNALGIAFVDNVSGGLAPYSYQWNDALLQTTDTAFNLSEGNYEVVVTDYNGCSATDNVIVSLPDALFFSLASDSASCFGGTDGRAYVDNISGGALPYSYLWSGQGNQTTASAENLPSGVYTLTITDANDCVYTESIEVFEPTALIATISSQNLSCSNNNSGEVEVSASGGIAPYNYLWSNGVSGGQISGLAAGNYTVTVTDANGCVLIESRVLTQPDEFTLSFDVNDVSCFGGSDASAQVNVLFGGTQPYSFAWDAAAGNQQTQVAQNLQAGTYNVTITDVNNCISFGNIVVNQPDLLLASLQFTDVTCAGLNDGTAQVMASGGVQPYSYLWNNSSSSAQANVSGLPVGTYEVVVTDNNGCLARESVTISQPDIIDVQLIADSVSCFGGSDATIEVLASGGTGSAQGFEYSINGGNTFQSSNIFENIYAGVWGQIVVRDLGSTINCISLPYSVEVFQPEDLKGTINPQDTTIQLTDDLMLSIVINSNSPYQLSDIVEVLWFPAVGLSCSDCLTPSVYNYEDYTEYSASVVYPGYNGAFCFTSFNSVVKVDNTLQFFIPNAFTPNGDGINDKLFVYGNGLKDIQMQIFNRWGEKIFETNNQSEGWDGTYKGNHVNPGVFTYFFEATYLDEKRIEQKGTITVIK
jgi:gliding motility-associated-like protein